MFAMVMCIWWLDKIYLVAVTVGAMHLRSFAYNPIRIDVFLYLFLHWTLWEIASVVTPAIRGGFVVFHAKQ